MELFENTQAFNDAVVATSNYYHLSPSFVEKDYNDVTLFLLNDKLNYDEAISSLIRIAQSSLFD